MAQLVARLVRNEKVRGSNPLSSTSVLASPGLRPQLQWWARRPLQVVGDRYCGVVVNARPRLMITVAFVMGVLLTGCSVGQDGSDPDETKAADWVPFDYAMTGLAAPEGAVRRPVVAIKIDDTSAGQPQQGTAQADLVVQEPVEGGLTRLLAFYESRRPDSVGPVRSIRATDIPLVKPVRATVVASGGSEPVIQAFALAGVPLLTDPNDLFVRNPERSAPYDLYADLSQSISGPMPRKDYLQFGQEELPVGKQVSGVTVSFSPASQTKWNLTDSQEWRQDNLAPRFKADTLAILGVGLKETGLLDAAGTPVPEVEVVGRGRGFLIVGDELHRIRWRKESPTSAYQFSTDGGLVISVPPGHTWISLLPREGGKVSFS